MNGSEETVADSRGHQQTAETVQAKGNSDFFSSASQK